MAAVAAVAVMLLVGALWNLTSLCVRVADAEWERDKLLHARTDVPDLIAEVRRLTAALATVTAERDAACIALMTARGEVNDARAALATARREGAEEMRWAASEAAEQWLIEVEEVTEDSPADLADAIRALPLDAAGGEP